MNYYERHLGDYARDTGHLSQAEHGAYNLLLDRYYATEKPIPAQIVYGVGRAKTAAERKAVDSVLAQFFTLNGDGYEQKRVLEEIQRLREKSDKARKSAEARWHSERNANASVSHGSSNAPPVTSHQATEKKPPDGGTDPKALMWKTGVAVLTAQGETEEAARRFLGKFAKDETKLAEVVAHCAANPKVDAKAYIVAAINGGAKSALAAGEAFEEVRQRIRDGKPPGNWTHPQTEAALEAVGGWYAMKNANSRDNDFRRAPFCAAFNAAPAKAIAA